MNYHRWTQEEIDFLKAKYPNDMFASEISEALGISLCSVRNKVEELGLKATKEKIVRAARLSCHSPGAKRWQFAKGHVPANKGKKMSPEVYEKVKATMFKKGNAPKNHKEVGSERYGKDGYIEIKVAEPSVWMLKHRWIWIQAHGEIPKGMVVSFINGDKYDFRLENLRLKSMAENMNDNALINLPPELVKVIRLRGVLNRQIHKKNGKQ